MTGNPDLRSTAVTLALAFCLAACSDDDYGGDGYVPPPPGGGGGAGIAIVDAFPSLSFGAPLAFATAPGDTTRAFVATQDGVIHAFENRPEVTASSVFLDIDARVTDHGGEMGLLGFAFHPDYASNGLVYVNYNPNFDDSGSNPMRTQISRFTAAGEPRVADPDSEESLLTFEQPFTNHNGGWLGFGPDGKLYIASGDGGDANDPDNNAQNLDNLLGKILRLNADGSIPAENPFVNIGGRDEIWAYGLRNPFRASFDRQTGDLWAGDVGQSQREEVDRIGRGGNYGWRKFEGTRENPAAAGDPVPADHIAPVHEYAHSDDPCGATIIGGYVYRGAALSGVAGRYFFADFCSGQVWHLLEYLGDVQVTPVGVVPGMPTSFGEDAAGELYITSFDGHVYKLVPAN